MRWKIIAIYSVVVAVVGLLAFALMRASIGDLVSNPDRARAEADRSASAAAAQLQLEALSLQRWLSEQEVQARDVFTRETPEARGEAATNLANRLFSMADAEFKQSAPTVVAFVDSHGVGVGRNGSTLMRGDDLGKAYPALVETLKKGTTGADVWVNKTRGEQLLVSYTTVTDPQGKPLGGVLVGTSLSDGRLSSLSDGTSGRPIGILVANGDKLELVAKSATVNGGLLAAASGLKGAAADRPVQLQGAPAGFAASGVGLRGYGDGKRAMVVAFAPVSIVESVTSMLWPILGATGLGLVLVFVAGNILGNYLNGPIVELEEGLLQIINGQGDRRFEIEHAEFGGLVFRINQLLNTLMDVPEDDTDAEGRPSHPPRQQDFQEAMAVGGGGDEDAYYDKLYSDYIAAKRGLGDAVDHITKDAFVQRMRQSAAEQSAQQGRPVRFRVEVQGREVKLLAV